MVLADVAPEHGRVSSFLADDRESFGLVLGAVEVKVRQVASDAMTDRLEGWLVVDLSCRVNERGMCSEFSSACRLVAELLVGRL